MRHACYTPPFSQFSQSYPITSLSLEILGKEKKREKCLIGWRKRRWHYACSSHLRRVSQCLFTSTAIAHPLSLASRCLQMCLPLRYEVCAFLISLMRTYATISQVYWWWQTKDVYPETYQFVMTNKTCLSRDIPVHFIILDTVLYPPCQDSVLSCYCTTRQQIKRTSKNKKQMICLPLSIAAAPRSRRTMLEMRDRFL